MLICHNPYYAQHRVRMHPYAFLYYDRPGIDIAGIMQSAFQRWGRDTVMDALVQHFHKNTIIMNVLQKMNSRKHYFPVRNAITRDIEEVVMRWLYVML